MLACCRSKKNYVNLSLTLCRVKYIRLITYLKNTSIWNILISSHDFSCCERPQRKSTILTKGTFVQRHKLSEQLDDGLCFSKQSSFKLACSALFVQCSDNREAHEAKFKIQNLRQIYLWHIYIGNFRVHDFTTFTYTHW